MTNLIKVFSLIALFFVINTFAQVDSAKLSEIKLSITTRQGTAFPNVDKDDFSLVVGKTLQKIESIEKAPAKSLEFVLMIDVSVSQEKVLPFSKQIAVAFVDYFSDAKKLSIALNAFSSETIKFVPMTNNIAEVKSAVKDLEIKFPEGYVKGTGIVVSSLPFPPKNISKGSTSLWDGINLVAEKSFSQAADTEKIIVLFSDGMDTSSETKKKAAARGLIGKQVRVYAIGLGDDAMGGISSKNLKLISDNVGGKAFVPGKTDDLIQIFEEIKRSIASTYLIKFSPAGLAGKEDFVEVKVEIISPEKKKLGLKLSHPKEIPTK